MTELEELKKVGRRLSLMNHLLTQINFTQQTINTANYGNRVSNAVFNIWAIIISLIGVVYSVYVKQLTPTIYAVFIALLVLFIYNLYNLFKARKRMKNAYEKIYAETKKLAEINKKIDEGIDVRITYEEKDFIEKL
jgi:Flp pilus assembly protein TadB